MPSGMTSAPGIASSSGNSFDSNTYIVADGTSAHWDFTLLQSWDGIKALGYEENGQLLVERPAAIRLSCDR